MKLAGVLFLLLIAALAPPTHAQSALSGIVRRSGTGRPLPGVEVLVEGTGLRATTGENGRYLLTGLAPGSRMAIFRSVGHLPVRVPILLVAGDTLRANATLIASEVVLAPVVVEGKVDDKVGVGVGREAFGERQRLGFGKFYDSAILRQSEHLPLHDLLRRQGGVSVEPRVHDGSRKWIAFNPYLRRGRDLDCAMQVYFNGSKLGERRLPRRSWRSTRSPDVRPLGPGCCGGLHQRRPGSPGIRRTHGSVRRAAALVEAGALIRHRMVIRVAGRDAPTP